MPHCPAAAAALQAEQEALRVQRSVQVHSSSVREYLEKNVVGIVMAGMQV